MRALSRDLDEQINSIKRELDNLSAMWVLKYKEELRKKIFYVNPNFLLLDQFKDIFLKTDLEVVIIHENIKNKLIEDGKNMLDIFMIWDIDKDDFNDFLAGIFYNRKVKYAIISTDDFYSRLSYWDKLIKNILNESGNIYLKDNLKVREKHA